jgi:putative transposase
VKKSKSSEEQIVRILKGVEAGAKVAETCRKHRISEPTYYTWKQEYAGMDVSQLRRLKEMVSECSRLKKMRGTGTRASRPKGRDDKKAIRPNET